jgi:hypothetical protein
MKIKLELNQLIHPIVFMKNVQGISMTNTRKTIKTSLQRNSVINRSAEHLTKQ